MRSYDLALDGRDPLWPELVNLLQTGFRIEVEGEKSVRDFMREALLFDDAYIEGSISTVFVDSQPVDDLDAARVGPGSRLALSAAMPGLVGAIMRIKSPYASFRSAISYGSATAAGGTASAGAAASAGATAGRADASSAAAGEPAGEGAAAAGTGEAGLAAGRPAAGKPAGGLVLVKLFNAVMAERGPALLERGLLVDLSELAPLAERLGAAERAPAELPRLAGAAFVAPADSASSEAQSRQPAADGHAPELAFLRVRAAPRSKNTAGSDGEVRR